MKALESVGIAGYAGDLGSQLVAPLANAYDSVIGYDISRVGDSGSITVADDIEGLLRKSSVVHWCVPIDSVRTIPSSAKFDLLVLHDSVMSNSLKAAEALKKRRGSIGGSVAIVHFLMNDDRKVVVSADSDELEVIEAHIKEMGFDPKVMNTVEHDRLMAHSQAPLAVLCDVLLPRLRGFANEGLLTPSAQALLTALNDRAANWTEATFAAILSNPELHKFMQEMGDEIAKKHKS